MTEDDALFPFQGPADNAIRIAVVHTEADIARLAATIASGLVSKPDLKASGYFGAAGLAEWMQAIPKLSVGLARGIVQEAERTAPKP